MANSEAETFEKLAAAASAEEVKSVLKECGYSLKMSASEPDDDEGGNPFAKKEDGSEPSLAETRDKVVSKNFKKFAKKEKDE